LLDRQHKTVDELRRDGHDVRLASDLLDSLKESQRLLLERRNLLGAISDVGY